MSGRDAAEVLGEFVLVEDVERPHPEFLWLLARERAAGASSRGVIGKTGP